MTAAAFLWPVVTIGLYFASKAAYQRRRLFFLSPIILVPTILIALTLATGTRYQDYIGTSFWLVMALGPATVAFAVPVYEQRATIRRFWPALGIGAVFGSVIAIVSAWALAKLMLLEDPIMLSLLPRSVSTPFAMTVSEKIGGIADLTAVLVVITGVTGALGGGALLKMLPLRSALSRGAMFGMGAHGVGVARAHQVGVEEGTIAGLVMVFAGILNVLSIPLLTAILG